MPPSSPFLAGICSSIVAFVALTYRDVHNKSFHVRADVPAHAENFMPLLFFLLLLPLRLTGAPLIIITVVESSHPPPHLYPQDLKPISIFILAWVFVSKPEILPLLATGVINEPGIIYLTPTR